MQEISVSSTHKEEEEEEWTNRELEHEKLMGWWVVGHVAGLQRKGLPLHRRSLPHDARGF